MGCQHPATKRRPVGLQNRNLGRTCQPMSFTDRQNVSDLLPHVTDLPSSGVEVKSAEVAVQWRNIYSKFILACIYPPPTRRNSPLQWVRAVLIINASRSHSGTPQSVRLLWTSDQPYLETSTWQHTTDFHVPGGFRTRNPNKRADADPCLRSRGIVACSAYSTITVHWNVMPCSLVQLSSFRKSLQTPNLIIEHNLLLELYLLFLYGCETCYFI